MSIRNYLLSLFALLFFGACASSELDRQPANSSESSNKGSPVELNIKSRDEVMGPNRAKNSVLKKKASREYVYRNIASAFPDNGKNMMLKDRSTPKAMVAGALDHSPWHLSLYGNSEHIKKQQARFNIANKGFNSTPLLQKEAMAQISIPKKSSTVQPFYQTDSFGVDDAFEPNDSVEKAFDLASSEETWLGNLGSEGVQWSEDWYKVWVSPQYRRLLVDLRFQHYLGDIDMKIYDSKGEPIAISQGLSDDEFLHIVCDRGGFFYIQVFGSNRGNRYDLKFSTYFTGGGDDEYEDNDSLKMAYDLRGSEGNWLSETKGEGVAADDDYYLIQAKAGKTRFLIDLRVQVNKGDVDMRLLSSDGKIVASSSNIGDDDLIDFTVSEPGNYYLKIYPFHPSATFNMYDLKWQSFKPMVKLTQAGN